MHPWTITRRIGTGSILKDMAFVDNENGVDTLLLSEEGQTVFVGLKCDYTTASKIPIFDASKKLVSSGVDSIKITYLDNVSSDLQTQLNNKLNLSGSNANQNIVLGGYKIQSTATPTVNSDYTTKLYVDGQISGLGSVYLPLSGGIMTGDINGASFNYLRWGRSGDVRNNLAPNYVPGGAFSWYFGTYANNNTGSFADHLIPNGWVDTSGGLTNMLSLNKGSKGIRQFQQTYGSASGFSTWYDCVLTDANSADVSIGGVLTAPTVNVSGQTASRVCVFDGSKNVVSSSVSSTTLGYLDIGSSLTGLLNLKSNLSGGNTFSGDQVFNSGTMSVSSRLLGEPLVSGNFLIGLRGTGTESDRLGIAISGNSTTGAVSAVVIPKTLTLPTIVSQRVLILDGSNNVQASSVDSTTLTYLDIGSSLTGLLNLKANLSGTNTFTGTNTFSSATPLTLSGLTASRVLQLNASGNVESSAVSSTTLGYLDIGSSLTGLLNLKSNLSGGNTFTGFQTFSDENASRVATFDVAKRLRASSTTILELSYLSGVSSSLQPQLDGKVSKTGDLMSGELKFSNNLITEWGVGLTKEINAYKIGASWVTANSLDIVGGGVTAGSRQVICYDRLGVGMAPTESFQTVGNAIIAGTMTANSALLANQLSVYNETIDNDSRYVINSFRKGWSNFQAGSESSITYTLSSSGINGPQIMRMNTYVWPRGPKIQLDQNKTYQVEFNIRRLGTASANTFYLAVQEYNWLGTNLAGDGADWYYPVSLAQNTLADGVWYNYKASVGPNGGKAHASTARYISVGFIVNYSSGTDLIEVSNLKIFPIEDDIKSQFRVSGNVGIGTTNPATALHLARAFTTDGDYSNMISFENTQPGGYVEWQMGPQVIGGAGCFGIRGGTDGFSGLSNLLTIRAVSSTQGYFGINTTTPSAPLTVNGSITIKSANGVYEAGCIYSDVNWGMLMRGAVAPNLAHFRWDTSAGGELMRIDTSGNLGINITPRAKLDVEGDIITGWGNYRIGTQYLSNTSGYFLGLQTDVNNRVLNLVSQAGDSTGSVRISTGVAPTERMRITASGQVGIGTTSPTGVLDVYNTTADYTNSVVIRTPWSSVVLDNTQIAGGNKWSVLAGSTGAGVKVGGFGIFDITGGAYRMGILKTGQIQLGPYNSRARVGVMGGNATGNVSTTTAWPDDANGILISDAAADQTSSTSALFLGHQQDLSTINSLAPSVAWKDLYVLSKDELHYTNGSFNVYLLSGTSGWLTVSDVREKEDIQPLKTDKSLQRVLALKPYHYRRKFYDSATPVEEEIKQKRQIGFLAQDVKESNPHCVNTWCNKEAIKKRDEAKVEIDVEEEEVKVEINIEEEEDDGERFSLNYNDYVIHLVGAVQEQQRMIETLTQRNQTLEDRLQKLEDLLKANGML
jgi:hypothetical protein